MAYDEGLAERIRDVLRMRARVSEKEMFGGVAFMLDGHMALGIVGDTLMPRWKTGSPPAPDSSPRYRPNEAILDRRAHARRIGRRALKLSSVRAHESA